MVISIEDDQHATILPGWQSRTRAMTWPPARQGGRSPGQNGICAPGHRGSNTALEIAARCHGSTLEDGAIGQPGHERVQAGVKWATELVAEAHELVSRHFPDGRYPSGQGFGQGMRGGRRDVEPR